jgi:hypothetical protein
MVTNAAKEGFNIPRFVPGQQASFGRAITQFFGFDFLSTGF